MRKYPEPTSEALIESALKNVDILDRHNFPDFKVSVKASEVFMAVAAYRGLAQQIEQPLHLGMTLNELVLYLGHLLAKRT